MTDLDVLIVGAGISGIGAAVHLTDKQPGKTYAILEAREAIGGTWDLFRYPGVRSDSDLHTFCYAFKPWIEDKAIADAPSILRYVRETAAEHRVEEHIRFGHRVLEAHWSTQHARWTVVAEHGGERVELTARWLFCAGGYYDYDEAFTPEFPGRERFGGPVVHPQFWPEDLDYEGKRVVVIGSGATAMTIVPAMAQRARHVTLLQRTPTYVVSAPAVDPIAAWLKTRLGPERAHRVARWKNLRLAKLVYGGSRRYPDRVRRMIRAAAVRALPEGYDVDTHFNPPYGPWDQRMCLIPDGDLFVALGEGNASMVTDRIETFTEAGIRLESGEELEADIVVTATGLKLVPLAGVSYTVDGEPVRVAETVTYKGMMLTGVPNLVYAFGYTNNSWTLKVDLICEHFCRLLALMDERGQTWCVPEAPPAGSPTKPVIDLASGYVQRAVADFPRQGSAFPWEVRMDYLHDRKVLLDGPVGDHLRFGPAHLPPGPRMPRWAAGLVVLTNRWSILKRLKERYGDAFTIDLPVFGPGVIVSSPELVKQMFTASPDVLRFGEASPLGRVLGPGSLFSLDGAAHLRERRLLLPPFHGDRMKSYEAIIEEEARRELATWPQSAEFETLPSFMRITLNAILRAVFGAEGPHQRELAELLPGLVGLGSKLTMAPWALRDLGPLSPGGRFARYRRRYDRIIGEMIDETLADPRLEERADVMALLLRANYDDGSSMSRSAIADELLTLLAAGHETTATSLAWGVERLRRHPEIVARLQPEADGDGRELRAATINEIQRTRPVITGTGRLVATESFELGPWRVPKGYRVFASATMIHNDARFFERPFAFDPDRFLGRKPDTYTWIPFGGGTRRCIGAAFAQMEMDIVLRTLLRELDLQPTSEPGEKWRSRGVAFAPARGGRAVVRRRPNREVWSIHDHRGSEQARVLAS